MLSLFVPPPLSPSIAFLLLEVGLVWFCFVFKVDIVIGIVLLVCGPVGLFGLQLQTLYTVSLYLLRAKQPHQFYFVRKRVGAGRPKRQHLWTCCRLCVALEHDRRRVSSLDQRLSTKRRATS